jgi:hypothetical protein
MTQASRDRPADPLTIGDFLTTLNRSLSPNRYHLTADGATQLSQAARGWVVGRYTDVDTLAGEATHARRPGMYTEVDTITRPSTAVTFRSGSYIDIDTPSARVPALGCPGRYTDADSSVR